MLPDSSFILCCCCCQTSHCCCIGESRASEENKTDNCFHQVKLIALKRIRGGARIATAAASGSEKKKLHLQNENCIVDVAAHIFLLERFPFFTEIVLLVFCALVLICSFDEAIQRFFSSSGSSFQ